MYKKTKTLFITVAMVTLLFSPDFIHSENEISIVREQVEKTLDIKQRSQKQEDQWVEEMADIKSSYKSLLKEKKRLNRQLETTGRSLSIKSEKISEMKRRIKESTRVQEELHSYLDSVIKKLNDSINRGLPFHLEKRKAVISSLKDTLADPEKDSSEKYAKVMEALRKETEYGRSVEVYPEKILFQGDRIMADILRVGRISLFFITTDYKNTGHYHPSKKQWLPLPSKYRSELKKAVQIAERQRSIEFVKLPVGRIMVK